MKTLFHKGEDNKLSPVGSDPSADVVFIVGGLKAALNSQKPVRDSVMTDVSKALNCEPEDLNFLFAEDSSRDDDPNGFDFPDAERRRTVIRNNFLDAAE